MSYPFDCPRCGKHYELTAKHVGRRVKCAQCNTQTRYYPAAIPAPLPPQSPPQTTRVRPPERRDAPPQPRGPIPSPLALRAFFWLSTICIVASTFGYLVIAFSVYKLYSAERDIEKLEVQQIKDERALRQPDPPFRDMGPGENFEEFQRRNEADLRAHDRQQNEYFRERDTSRKKFREARTKLDDKIESYSIVLVLGLLLNGLAQIAAIPFILTCIYKMWAVIQDGRARTSPAKAAFCLLIPFYSLYWIFVAVHGWTGDANKYIARYKLDIEPVSPGLSLLACIAMLTRGIPGCGLLLEVFIVGIGLHWLFVATSTAADIAEERLAKEPARDGFVS